MRHSPIMAGELHRRGDERASPLLHSRKPLLIRGTRPNAEALPCANARRAVVRYVSVASMPSGPCENSRVLARWWWRAESVRRGPTHVAALTSVGSGRFRRNRLFLRLADAHGSRRRRRANLLLSGHPRHDTAHPQQTRYRRLRAVRLAERLPA